MQRILLAILLLGLLAPGARAAHLVGGDLSFSCQGNNRYNFRLTVYRDRESSTGAAHDQPAYIFIYNLDNNQLFNSYSANYNTVPLVANNDLGPCLQNPDPPNLDFAVYRFNNINLPPNGRGYRVVYQRCCRSEEPLNLQSNFDGFGQGSSYEVLITPAVIADCGGAGAIPELTFDDPPPTQWCANELVTNDQSVDPLILAHVDSVVYSLCAPFDGGSGSDCVLPSPADVGNCSDFTPNCSQPCPYSSVRYNAGYTAGRPMGLTSLIEIDPQTGLLSVEPTNLGVFVVGICATAYKNGQPWATIARDFSFKVFDCVADAASDPVAVNGATTGPALYPGVGQVNAAYLVCSDYTVPFSQTSPNALSHFWDFGVPGTDADTSILPFPSFTFPDTGTYLITYVVNRNEPCVDTAYGVVRIFPRVNPGFGASFGCFTLPVQFTDTTLTTLSNNQVVAWDWDFGDGTTLSGVQEPQHTYAAPGNYTVELEVTTALGCVDNFSLQVSPEPSPVAAFGNLLGCTGAEHQFENLSTLNGTALESYSWNFGSGFGLTTTNDQPPVQVYPDSGLYTIQLAATSLNGCSDTATAQLLIVDQVEPAYSWLPASICPGQEVQFTNETLEYYDSLRWTIDGTVFRVENPLVTFTTPGEKQVTLEAWSNGICGGALTMGVTVEIGPLAYFETDSTCTGSTYTFVNESQENGIAIDAFFWEFGDGATSTDINPTHIYTVPGDYTVQLVAFTELVCSDTFQADIPVKEGIVPDFTWQPDTICEASTSVSFENTSSGGPWDAVHWDFGDDSTSAAAAPAHIYAGAGFYEVFLEITDDICGVLETSRTVEVLDVPDLDLPDTLNICDGIRKTLRVDDRGSYLVYWSTGDSLTDRITIDNRYDSVQVVVNNRGCINSDVTVITRDCPAYLPNTFTPNGDGVNDYFGPLDYNITSFTLRIYNRFGEEVFATSSFSAPWDGTYKGKPAPLDTYVYSFSGIGLDEKELFQIGTVTILR